MAFSNSLPFLASLIVLGQAAASAPVTTAFPAPFNSGENLAHSPVSAADAAATLKLPPGFKATVFASEPDIQNPIAMAWDAQGRLWVAENYTYAERATKFEMRLRDRVLIFEDQNGDGRFSSRRVFTDDVQHLTSVELGHGGVWLMCPPQLLFMPDRNEDGVPDGPAEIVLDGFTIPTDNHHTFANGLRFGPDGWLYGRGGASSQGELGLPGTPNDVRVPLRGTIWRYHPQKKTVEALSSGTTNPWGHDWDRHGELFFINTVNGHLWHGITGAHYKRPHTIDPNPHTYELLEQHADHWHFDTAQSWTESRAGAANSLGGGHAHAGMMIYQGDNWPAAYQNKLYTLNFHGRRANQEILARRGSGYVGSHGPDFFLSEDPWFRGIEISSGPDGGVFVLDWSDMGECHNALGVSRTSGRIFKVVHGEARRNGPANLSVLNSRELVGLQSHANDRFVRQSRLQLADRAARGHDLTDTVAQLRVLFAEATDPVLTLRALWTLYGLGAANGPFLREQLQHENEHLRTWAIRLLTDHWPLDSVLSQRPARSAVFPAVDRNLLDTFIGMARSDSSGLVRLALASVLQRLDPPDRVDLARALTGRSEDAGDHNLPLLIWYGLIPVAEVAPDALAKIGRDCALPTTRRLIARRLAGDIEKNPTALNALIAAATTNSAEFKADLIAGIGEGLNGWRQAPKPAAWNVFIAALDRAAPAALLERIRDLNILFGDGRALDDVKAIALDPKAELPARMAALRALIENRPPDLRRICEQVLRVRFLNTVAARGLALFNDPAIGDRLVAAFSSFHHSERASIVETLVSRPAFARALLRQVDAGRIPRSVITPFHARQIRSFGDAELTAQLAQTWGELRESKDDKEKVIARFKAELTPDVLAAADKSQGRVLFANLCGACHRLYGHGGDIGPDLTGAGRDNLDYVLENTLDPSAVVTADYRNTVVKLKDGRTLNGFIAAQSTRTLTVRGMTETHTVERADVAAVETSPYSMMPDGLLETLTTTQRRDLVAYLTHLSQVPLP